MDPASPGIPQNTILVNPMPPGTLQDIIFVNPAPLETIQNSIFVDLTSDGRLQNTTSSIQRLLEASRTYFRQSSAKCSEEFSTSVVRALVQTWAPYRTALVFASLAADLARVLHAMIPIAPLKIHHRVHHRTRNTGCQAVRADVFRLSSLIWELRQLPSLLAVSASMPASSACCAASIILRPLFGFFLSGIREAITIWYQNGKN